MGIPKRLSKAMFDLKKNDEIMIMKADKGGKVVVMDKIDYSEKMDVLLNDENTYKEIRSDPLKKWQQSFNKKIKTLLYRDYPELYKKFQSYLPSHSYMYGLPKLHKAGIPMRPITSTRNSVTYNLASWLAKQLSPALGKISQSHLKDTCDFVEKIKGINLHNKRLVSFDVESLYTRVPIEDCIDILGRKIGDLDLDLPVPNEVFVKLVELCVSDCFFVCNNKNYSQIFGLPMGSPLSPVLSNIFMENFETELLPNITNFSIKWFRYVDDIFAVVPANLDVNNFLSDLNDLHPSINFKVEYENNSSLPFLDTLVLRSDDSFPVFKIYRKPTHCDIYIHSFSNHSDNVKLGVISNLYLRAHRVCDPQYLDEELNFIENVFLNLGYCRDFINKAHSKAKRTYFQVGEQREFLTEDKTILILPQIRAADNGWHSNLKKSNIIPVFKNMNTIKKVLSSNKKQNMSSPCIYKIPCNECNKIYIGETIDFDRRKLQHRDSIRKADENSAIFQHMKNKNHGITVNNATKIAYYKDTERRN